MLAAEYGPASTAANQLGEPVTEPVWEEPYTDAGLGQAASFADPAGRYASGESVELAFVALLQQLPGTQRPSTARCSARTRRWTAGASR